MRWIARVRQWWRDRPCHTEMWIGNSVYSVPCDAYWAAHEAELAEIRRRREEAERLATRPEFV
jgi:hypothetical protein